MKKHEDFCLKCGSKNIERFYKRGKLTFKCHGCKKTSFRVFTKDNSRLTKTKRGWKHFSVGAVINKGNRILLIAPSNYPFEYKFPAGHVDKDETPKEALGREIKEEIGLKVISYKLLYSEILENDPCSRGVNIHQWYLFEAKTKGKIKKSNEYLKLGWFSNKDIKKIKLNNVCRYWLKKVKFLQ